MQSQKNTFLENGHIVIMFATLIFVLLGLEIRSAHNKTDLAFDSYGYAPLYASAMTADEAAPVAVARPDGASGGVHRAGRRAPQTGLCRRVVSLRVPGELDGAHPI